MARKAKETVKMNLFSFLDILSGVIGVFTLIIVGMTVISLETTEQILKMQVGAEMLKRPSYIECQESGLILQPEGFKIPGNNIASSTPLKHRLDFLEDHVDDQYLVFLIRPNGGENFERARAMATARDLVIGYEPIYDVGPVKFKTVDGVLIEPTGQPVEYLRTDIELEDEDAETSGRTAST